jgi:hypothetical protein
MPIQILSKDLPKLTGQWTSPALPNLTSPNSRDRHNFYTRIGNKTLIGLEQLLHRKSTFFHTDP